MNMYEWMERHRYGIWHDVLFMKLISSDSTIQYLIQILDNVLK